MRLTRTGIGVVVGSILFLVGGIALGLSPLVGFGAAGIVAVLIALVFVVEPPSIDVHRIANPPTVERGSPAMVTLEFRPARGRARAFTALETVAGELRTASLPAIAPGHVVPIMYEMETSRRGNLVAGPMLLRRVDPFGLVQAERRIGGTCTVSVRPRRHPLSMLPSGRFRDLEGPTREVSKGTASFHQLREYVPGDDMRHIHWRSSARTGTLVVKQLVDTTRPEVVVVVDNRRAVVSADDFEEVVEVAASILQAAENDGFPALLIFADGANEPGSDGVPIPFIDRLTSVTRSDTDSLMEVAEAIRARGRSLVFITGELGAGDITLVNRVAQGFSPAYLVSVVGDRRIPFIAPPGMTGIGAASAAEFPGHWSSVK